VLGVPIHPFSRQFAHRRGVHQPRLCLQEHRHRFSPPKLGVGGGTMIPLEATGRRPLIEWTAKQDAIAEETITTTVKWEDNALVLKPAKRRMSGALSTRETEDAPQLGPQNRRPRQRFGLKLAPGWAVVTRDQPNCEQLLRGIHIRGGHSWAARGGRRRQCRGVGSSSAHEFS
jgi:hypothetical protein